MYLVISILEYYGTNIIMVGIVERTLKERNGGLFPTFFFVAFGWPLDSLLVAFKWPLGSL